VNLAPNTVDQAVIESFYALNTDALISLEGMVLCL